MCTPDDADEGPVDEDIITNKEALRLYSYFDQKIQETQLTNFYSKH